MFLAPVCLRTNASIYKFVLGTEAVGAELIGPPIHARKARTFPRGFTEQLLGEGSVLVADQRTKEVLLFGQIIQRQQVTLSTPRLFRSLLSIARLLFTRNIGAGECFV